MTFWTIEDECIPTHTLTLCDSCALFATNAALVEGGMNPAGSMSQAYTILSALLATAGLPAEWCESSPIGRCGQCGNESTQEAS